MVLCRVARCALYRNTTTHCNTYRRHVGIDMVEWSYYPGYDGTVAVCTASNMSM
jgi:hypothetical protein